MPKGLAAEDTKRLVLSQVDSDFTKHLKSFGVKTVCLNVKIVAFGIL